MKVNAEERAEKAKSLFKEGYNCSQSVLLAYCDFLGLDKQLAANITAPLGGGMGRLREAVSYTHLSYPYTDKGYPL